MISALRQWRAPALVVVVAAVLAPMALRYIAPLGSLETKLQDIRIAALQPPEPPATGVVVVALDEETIAQFPYRSPIDRGFLADVITTLGQKGARAIGVDVIIDQPTETAKDARLRNAIAAAPVPVRFSYTASPRMVTAEQRAFLDTFIPPDRRVEATLLTDPFDGMVRRINPGGRIVNGQRVFDPRSPPGFVPAMVALAGGTPGQEPVAIAWRPRPDAHSPAIPTYSASYLRYVPDTFIRGKIVLVGAVLSMTDRHLTPLAIIDDGDLGHMPGVLIHAHGISQFLEGRRAPVVPLAWQVGAAGLFALLGVLASLLKKGVVFNLGAALLLAVLYWVGAILGYGYGLPMLPVLGPSFALGLSMWMMDLLIGRGERRQREFIQRTFSRYVSPAVVDELVRDPASATVVGKRREATFLFTDVAGFTTLSELLDPEALSEVLNAYLDGACSIILKHQGTIDKFIGDAIMAVFNAPVPQRDHVDRAVQCALDLDAYCEEFRARANATGIPIGVTRIGLHCGEAVIGNFGSHSRMDFTALGDTVNTAARTEGVNKYFGTRICCTEQIVNACPSRRFRKIGDIVLKGKHISTGLFVPIADEDDPSLIGDYADAYTQLQLEQGDAFARFDALVARFPHDPLARFHRDRLAAGARSTMVVMDDK